jgi:hypothetical protein
MKGSAVLLVKTNTTDTSIFNETTTKTGISAGKHYTHGVTCMVRPRFFHSPDAVASKSAGTAANESCAKFSASTNNS